MKHEVTIGVLIGNANSPYSIELMKGIRQAARNYKVNIIYYIAMHNSNTYKYYYGDDVADVYDYQNSIVYEYTKVTNVDALIIAYGSLGIFMEENNLDAFLSDYRHIPYVLIGDKDMSMKGSSIIADNYDGMRKIVEHLVQDEGYRNLTYLAGPKGNKDADERNQAVIDTISKFHIDFDESHMEYGDFSSCVEEEIKKLFDRHPDMEAMICANDLMANSVYEICRERGIIIGKDLAVTGFDDWENASTMDPPLTTVVQNAMEIGFMAVDGVIRLMKGDPAGIIVVPSQLRIRASSLNERKLKPFMTYIDGNQQLFEDIFINEILLIDNDRSIRNRVKELLSEFLNPGCWKKEQQIRIFDALEEIYHGTISRYISLTNFTLNSQEYIGYWLKQHIKEEMAPFGLTLLNRIRRLANNTLLKASRDDYADFQEESWLVPLISRDMMSNTERDQDFFRGAMTKLSALRIKNAALFIFEKPVPYLSSDKWNMDHKLHMVASLQQGEIRSYNLEDAPVLNKKEGLSSVWGKDNFFELSLFCLYSEENQYGFLAVEIDPSNLSLAYLVTMQIANALKFFALSQAQKATQRKLMQLIKEVREKNEVLNFISEYDALTNCLNRRGFLEKAMIMNHDHVGEMAMLVFADLDYLKEINDTFGHAEGDFAIKRCADVLKMEAGQDGIVGRIGGDEFVIMKPIASEDDAKHFVNHVKERNEYFNLAEVKPYFISCSMGTHVLTCSEELLITDIFKEADAALYQAKKRRKGTVIK